MGGRDLQRERERNKLQRLKIRQRYTRNKPRSESTPFLYCINVLSTSHVGITLEEDVQALSQCVIFFSERVMEQNDQCLKRLIRISKD